MADEDYSTQDSSKDSITYTDHTLNHTTPKVSLMLSVQYQAFDSMLNVSGYD